MSKGAVLISGAAGGIGLATVERFIASGYEVLGVDLDPAVKTLGIEGFRGEVTDVRDPDGLTAAIDSLLGNAELRHVIGLAGRVVEEESGGFDRKPAAAVEGFEASVALNLTGQYALIQAAFPGLQRTDGDRSIVLCSSVNALRGFGMPAYSAAKAGLIGMMHALATPLAQRGIRINVVAPGTTLTPLLQREMAKVNDPKGLERKAREIPMGRIGQPADPAAAIEALADRLTYVTDQVLAIDGGQLLAAPVDGPPRRWRRWWHNRPFR